MKKLFTNLTQKPLLLVLIFTFVTHLSYLNNGFTWLDRNDIEQKQAILPLSDLPGAFFRPFGQTSFYRPLVTILNSIDYFLHKLWAPGFHLTNLMLHLAVVALTPLFLSLFFDLTSLQKLLASVIVGVHPASILVVGWIIQRQEILLLIFVMLTVIFYTKAKQIPSLKYKALTFLSFAAALFSKETALFILPVLILFWEISNIGLTLSFRVPIKPGSRGNLWFGLIAIVILYLVLRFTTVPNLWGTKFIPLPPDQTIGTRLGLVTKWVLILLNPFKPNFSDAVPVVGLLSREAVISIVVIIMSCLIVIKLKVTSDLAKSILLVFVLIAPGLNIIPVPRIGSPHYTYLPSIAISSLFIIIIAALNNNLKKIAYFVLAIWIIIASITSFRSGFQFKNNLTLFKPEVEKVPDFYEGHYYLGYYYLKTGDLDNAEKEFEQALVEKPSILAFRNKWPTLINLAGVKLEKNKLEEAERLYKIVEKDTPKSISNYILYNFALVAYKKGDYKRVVELLSDKDLINIPQANLLLEEAQHALRK